MAQSDWLDSRQVRHAFSRAATSYDAVCVLQNKMAQCLLDRFSCIRLPAQKPWIMDLGCGTGNSTPLLQGLHPKAILLNVDCSMSMLQVAQKKRRRKLFDFHAWRSAWQTGLWRWPRVYDLCADMAQLAVQPSCVEVIWSNLALQWAANLPQVLQNCWQALKPGGLMIFSTLGPLTLQELRAACAQAGQGEHVSAFLDMHDVGDALVAAGFSAPVIETEEISMQYRQFAQIAKDLKHLGATNAAQGRQRGLMGKQRWQKISAAYEQFRDESGHLNTTWQAIYAHAWKPAAPSQKVIHFLARDVKNKT